MTILLTKHQDGNYSIEIKEPSVDEIELDFSRQEFEDAWQEAEVREELTNVILFGIDNPLLKTFVAGDRKFVDFPCEKIKDQARHSMPPVGTKIN